MRVSTVPEVPKHSSAAPHPRLPSWVPVASSYERLPSRVPMAPSYDCSSTGDWNSTAEEGELDREGGEGSPDSLCPSVCHPSPGAVRTTQLCPRPHVTQLPTGLGKLPGRAGEGHWAPDR